MKIIRKPLIYIPLILIIGIIIWILIPNFESDFDDTPRKSTQYWELSTGSKIAYTQLKSEVESIKSTIIYLHGGPGGYIDNSTIETYREISKQGYNVYLYDQIGCGLSKRLKNPDEYTVDRHSKDLKEILEKLNVPNVILVGQSWGGFLASYFVSNNPNLITKLVLTAPGQIHPVYSTNYDKFNTPDYIYKLTDIDERINKINTKINDFSFREIIWLSLAKVSRNTSFISDNKVDGILHKISKEFVKAMVCDSTIVSKPVGRPGMYCSMFTNQSYENVPESIRNDMKKYDKPVLILKPECDYLDWEFAHEYKELYPNSELKVIKKSGHSMNIENQQDYVSEIIKFIKSDI
ncbi:alpha/beta hydrolase [Aquimarina sp. ERC-38]|uniref:alpha/beta hydrolase n=1 Tax=Aquimarina sp. ERC-38 TaxID=2949996 RepID=UPI0022462039|nr:alpha/beta hydrolase [Aquimarina sp. ERC-38]UZO82184.1 alpha/beta hydrolase [Aquimarina sp. ERC-38]